MPGYRFQSGKKSIKSDKLSLNSASLGQVNHLADGMETDLMVSSGDEMKPASVWQYVNNPRCSE